MLNEIDEFGVFENLKVEMIKALKKNGRKYLLNFDGPCEEI